MLREAFLINALRWAFPIHTDTHVRAPITALEPPPLPFTFTAEREAPWIRGRLCGSLVYLPPPRILTQVCRMAEGEGRVPAPRHFHRERSFPAGRGSINKG